MKLIILDRYGWPIERIRGRWLFNLLRCLVHGRKVACWHCWRRYNEEAMAGTSNECAQSPHEEPRR